MAVEMGMTPRAGLQYTELKYLKNIFVAIIQKNELLFNNEIIRRIKTYRKNLIPILLS